MQNQIYPYLNKFFQSISVAFGKGSVPNTLTAMIGKWHQSLDSGGQAAAVLTYLWKAFDRIDH